MKILVINAGSSSLKYQLINMEDERVIAKGNCERIGEECGRISHKTAEGVAIAEDCPFPTHTEAFEKLVKVLTTGEGKVLNDFSEISAVGHRVVQGAELFSESVLVTEEVIEKINSISDLAPLHNPAHVLALRACQKVFDPSVPQVVVFDTAFHQTIPDYAYTFGIPYEDYQKYHARRYGFHGTSHRYVSQRFAEIVGKDLKDMKIVTCHLGNGSSITAVDGGKSVDTSMGFTPLDGVIMGTRSGCIDASLVLYLMEKKRLTPKEMSDYLNKKSGFLGISGFTNDNRDICKAAAEGNERAQLAANMLCYGIKKDIGSYFAAMGGLDAVVFTGGIGENSAQIRQGACEGLACLGIELDAQKNADLSGKEAEISVPGSKVKVWIVPTNEELLIARDTKEIVCKIK